MNATKAIKTYFALEPNAGHKMGARELLDFKASMDPAEYQELGRQACEFLGEPYDAPDAPESSA